MAVYNKRKEQITAVFSKRKTSLNQAWDKWGNPLISTPPGPTPTGSLKGLKWVPFGDSLSDARLTENARVYYFDWLKENDEVDVLASPVANSRSFGYGGTGYKKGYENGLCFYQRAEQIPADAQIITVFGSINDWSYAGVNSDGTDLGTPGSRASSVELANGSASLQEYMTEFYYTCRRKAPNAKIVVCSLPWYRLSSSAPVHMEYMRVRALRRAQYEFAKYFGLAFYDFTNDYGMLCGEHIMVGDVDMYGTRLWSGLMFPDYTELGTDRPLRDASAQARANFCEAFVPLYSDGWDESWGMTGAGTPSYTWGHWNDAYNKVCFYPMFKRLLQYEMGVIQEAPDFRITGTNVSEIQYTMTSEEFGWYTFKYNVGGATGDSTLSAIVNSLAIGTYKTRVKVTYVTAGTSEAEPYSRVRAQLSSTVTTARIDIMDDFRWGLQPEVGSIHYGRETFNITSNNVGQFEYVRYIGTGADVRGKADFNYVLIY